MLLVDKEMDNTNCSLDSFSALEEKSFSLYLLENAKVIEDIWQPYNRRYESELVRRVVFKDIAPGLKIYIKAYAFEMYSVSGFDSSTVSDNIYSLYRVFAAVQNENSLDIDSDLEELYVNYINTLALCVKNKVVQNNPNFTEVYTPRTVRTYAMTLLKFIIFLSNYSDKHEWASNYNVSAILPEKLAEYFNRKERQALQNDLVALQTDNLTKSIPWVSMYEIMKFVDVQPASYIKTAIVVMAEAGLRISEIRELTIDCLENVTKTEELAIQSHFNKYKNSAPLDLDYSESYWLNYYVIKGKNGVLEKGTPILVGKKVKKAIDELSKITAGLRAESGSNMLFLNKVSGGAIKVRGYSQFLLDRNRLIDAGMPYFKFHELRATFATILYRIGVHPGMIEKYMNHVSSDVTSRYINSQRKEGLLIINKFIDNNTSNINSNESYDRFSEELLSVVENSSFAGLSHGSQIKMFERLKKKHNIKISSCDHGTCVLPIEEACPNGYEEVNPCHASECNSFNPDRDEEARQFFILSLARTESKEQELKKFAADHGSVHINYDPINKAKRSLIGILKQIGDNYAKA